MRRIVLVVVGFIALAAVALSFKGGGSTTPTADDEVVPTTTTVAANITTTTLDPKAIQAGVAALLGHEGATPQQLAAVPANASSHHTRAGAHTKK